MSRHGCCDLCFSQPHSPGVCTCARCDGFAAIVIIALMVLMFVAIIGFNVWEMESRLAILKIDVELTKIQAAQTPTPTP